MKEQLEAQLVFARQRQEEAKYMEHKVWEGYIQGLQYALGLLKKVGPSGEILESKQIQHD